MPGMLYADNPPGIYYVYYRYEAYNGNFGYRRGRQAGPSTILRNVFHPYDQQAASATQITAYNDLQQHGDEDELGCARAI
ncbi:uncharacterized protein ARMOST_21185 [Armillaria ostoyae]|uniref:Uncharacterized protein n=1 Tax=Armillaria ostoyae TaxID=47428 RepID=A0A284S9F3_ARMOS|nr:uncharacterized protein ARMOST_21185 [Armillaria ostoyae]